MSPVVRRLAYVFAGLAALIAALVLALPSLLSLDSIRSRVLAAAESSLHRKVEAGEIRLEIFSGLGAGIEKLVVHNPPGWETPALATIDRFSVKVAFWPLLRKQLEVRRVVLDGAALTIERDPSGRLSVSDLLETPPPAATEPTAAPPAAILLSRLKISRSRLVFVDRRISPGKSVSTSLDDLTGEIADLGSASSGRFELSGRFLADGARNLSLAGTLGPPPPGKGFADAALHAKLAAKNLALARLRPYLGASSTLDPGVLSLDAALQGAPAGTLKVAANFWLVPPPSSSAIPAVDAKLALSYDAPGGSLTLAKSPLSIAKLPLTAQGGIDGLRQTARVNFQIATPGDVAIESVTGLPGLAGMLPAGTRLAGRVRLEATMQGTASDLAARAALDAAPFSVSRGTEVLFAAPAVRATLAAPGKAPMTGRVTAASGRIQKLPFQDLSADWSYDAGALTLAPALRAFGGVLRARVETDFAHPRSESKVGLDVAGMQAQQLADSLTSTRDVVSGTLAAKMSLATRGLDWDALSKTGRGEGRLSLTNADFKTVELMPRVASTLTTVGSVAGFQVPANLRSTRFNTVETSLKLADGRLMTPGLTLTGKDVAATADGWIGLDRSLSYDGRLVLQPGIVRSFGNVGHYIADAQGRVALPFRVTGQISSPKVAIDESVALDLGRRILARQAGDRIGGGAGKIVGDVLGGGDVLQQLLGKPPTPTPTPKPR
ncbi:MAG TPA: AsmA family protein [Thermoanaerobaculia bacterium]